MNYLSKKQVQDLLVKLKNGSDSTGNADLDYALYNFFQTDRGIQSTEEALLIANDWMLNRYHQVDGDVQLKFLEDIFDSLIPYCKEKKDFRAVQKIHTKLLTTFDKTI
jgi:hypothetical protein